MNKFKIPVFLVLLTAFSLFGFRMFMVTEWTIDLENVEISVTGKKLNAKMNGLTAAVKFSPEDLLNSKFEATLQAASIECKFGLQTKHAHSDKWLDVEKFPTVTFTSREIRPGDGGYEAVGDLNLHGVSKEIVLPFTFTETESGGTFHGNLHLMRTDYNIGNSDGGAVEEVDVEIMVPVKG